MQYLGLAIAWIRLSVIGALPDEMIAMNQVINPSEPITATLIATATIVMTVCMLSGPLFNAIFYKRFQNRMALIQQKNSLLMNTITGSLLGGMLTGILSAIIVGAFFSLGQPGGEGELMPVFGEVTLITLVSGTLIMGICYILLVKFKQKWIESYSLPLAILGAMTIAFFVIPLFA
jgi:uncharacterized membrane protein YciS (DUF1049 family)